MTSDAHMIMDLLFPYERKGRVNNASRCALLLPISVYCCYHFLCTVVTDFCAFSLPFSVHSGVLFTENPILWYGRLYFGTVLIVSTEKSVRAFNQVVLSKNCCFRSERASKIPLRYLNRKSSSKHTQLFCRTLYISKPYLLYMMLIFVSPIFGIGLPCL